MLSNIGNSLVVLSLATSILIIYFASHSLSNKNSLITKKVFHLSLYQSTFTIMAFFILITGFIISDFSLITVFQHSHTTKPFFYKIAGTWGNHEGSLLLWINVLVNKPFDKFTNKASSLK